DLPPPAVLNRIQHSSADDSISHGQPVPFSPPLPLLLMGIFPGLGTRPLTLADPLREDIEMRVVLLDLPP
ncbi:hypothetical protein NHX12_001872, partial [Muraenolepis orangiensis]